MCFLNISTHIDKKCQLVKIIVFKPLFNNTICYSPQISYKVEKNKVVNPQNIEEDPNYLLCSHSYNLLTQMVK